MLYFTVTEITGTERLDRWRTMELIGNTGAMHSERKITFGKVTRILLIVTAIWETTWNRTGYQRMSFWSRCVCLFYNGVDALNRKPKNGGIDSWLINDYISLTVPFYGPRSGTQPNQPMYTYHKDHAAIGQRHLMPLVCLEAEGIQIIPACSCFRKQEQHHLTSKQW